MLTEEGLIPRIRSKFTIGKDDDCWHWQAAKRYGGYGVVFYQGRLRAAHRLIFEMLKGSVPEGLTLDHLCRNRGCVNPDHLEPVTNAENLRRGIGQLPHENCRRGHPMTPENVIWDTPTARRCRICSRVRNRAAQQRAKDAH